MSAIGRIAGGLTSHGRAAAPMFRGSSIVTTDRLRNGLILSLDCQVNGIADFMFTAHPASRREIDIWHPLPEIERSLDRTCLKRTLHTLAGADSVTEAARTSFRLAPLGETSVTNLEL